MVHSRDEFSMPSAITRTVTAPGRLFSARAARSSPMEVTNRPIASSKAVIPRGSSVSGGTSAMGRWA